MRDFEHRPLGLLDQLLRRRLPFQHAGLDHIGGLQQRPELRIVADDPPVLPRMTGRGHPSGQLVDRLRAADLLQLAVLPQRLGDGQMVDLAVAAVQLEHRRKHRTVLLAVEVLRLQVLFDQQPVQVALIQQHRPQHRLLGLEVVGREGDLLSDAHRT
jgi:hypothetical protein